MVVPSPLTRGAFLQVRAPSFAGSPKFRFSFGENHLRRMDLLLFWPSDLIPISSLTTEAA